MKLTSFLVKPVMYVFGFKNQAKLIPKFKKTYKALDEGEVYYSDLKLDTPDEKRIVNFSLGCVMDTIYNHVHWDCVQVLNAFGYHVQISESNCCGSLASHSGEEKIAQKLKEKFFKKIKEESLPLVTNSAGCGAFIKEAQGELNLGVYDFIELLKNAPFNPLKDKSFKAEILYHPACHLNHRQGVSNLYEELLEDVQGLQVVTLDSKDTCCGSAGFYNLIRSEMAAKIGKDKIAEIIQREVKTLVTANPGCMSQIAAYLPEDFIVLHPASFIKKILFGRMP